MGEETNVIASVHRRAGRALVSLCAVASFAGLAPEMANAGAYDVKVCKDGYANGAMQAVGAGAQWEWLFRTTGSCDGGLNGASGISVSVHHGPESPDLDPYIPQNLSGNIYMQAPPGAGIRKVHVDGGRMASYYGNTTGFNPRVMVPSAGWCRTDGLNGNWCGWGWQHAADNSGQAAWISNEYPGFGGRDIGPITADVSDLAIGVVCNGGSSWSARPCYRPKYKPAAGVAVTSADIQVVDNAKPTISEITGPITWPGVWWKPGNISFGVTAWDNTGIQAFEKFVDGKWVGTDSMPCNYSLMKPCEDRGHNGEVNVSSFDGFHVVGLNARAATQYWLDCNVDCADRSITVATDGTAPGAPAATNNGPAWSKANAFALSAPLPATEADPDGAGPQARAPIARRIVTICPAGQSSGANCVVKDAPPATPGQDASAGSLTVSSEGVWDARLQLVDHAGNVGAASAPVALRLDQTAPGITVNQARGGFSITASDTASQPASITYRVDGKGDWVTVAGDRARDLNSTVATVAAAAGQHYVEVKATDNAGNVTKVPVRFDVTVPVNSENVNDLDPFGADSQLSVVDRGELNGLGGGESATLTASFVRGAKSKNTKPLTVRTINERGTAAIAGQLVDGQGRAIANARIDLGAAIAGGRTELKKGVAQTDQAGRFTIQLGKGLTSRGFTVAYMARVNDVKPAASAGVELVVKARATFKAHRPRVGKTKFSGFVSSGYLTKQGVEVKLQWKVGKRFRTFTTTRTDIKGRWSTSWRFERRGARYVMRALVTSSPAYAYKGAASRSRVVRIK